MAGLYLHYPFCKSRCYYCDFFSVTNTKLAGSFLEALYYEITLRKNFLAGHTIDTIYLGGGTPSLLNPEKLQVILDKIYENFHVADFCEITLEINPDDITASFLNKLIHTDVNRISLGIQAFYNYYLQLMNRRHKIYEALKALESLQNKGYDNISIDLIYGLPEMTIEEWEKTLYKTIKLNIQHISAYHLTYEKNTVFDTLRKKGMLRSIADNESYKQFDMMVEVLSKHDFIHYEISNFGRLGRFSRHNISYWKNIPYLGLGPAAHSYDGQNRYWNIADLNSYLNIASNKDKILQKEELSTRDMFNEYIMTGLRTYWGIDTTYIQKQFPANFAQRTIQQITPYIDSGHVHQKGDKYYLSRKGMFISDNIITELFT